MTDEERAPLANAPQDFEPATAPFEPRPLAAPRRTVHLIGNAHLDVVWLWPWQEGYQEARATFRSILDRMDEYPDFVFTCDQVVLLAWTLEQDPALFERIRGRVAEGRWVNTGGWWVEPDCNMPMGESFARQGLYGQRFLARQFGRPATIGMNVDPFGHAATLPQVLAQQGMGFYCFLRPMAHEKELPASLFRWQAPDGSSVVAYRIPFEYQTAWETVDRHIEKAVAELPDDAADVMVFYGVGNHGGGPTRAQIETVHRFDRMGSFGSLPLSAPGDYFAAVAGADLPVVTGDLQHHSPGCYSAHSQIKLWERRAQAAVLVAERWAAIAAIEAGLDVPRDDLARAWQQVLFNQAHDLLPGSAIEPAYDDVRDQLGEAVSIAKRITARAQNVLANRIDIPLDAATQPVVVFNPHPWPVTAEIELHLGVGRDVDPDDVTDAAGDAVRSQPIASRSQVGRSIGAAVAFAAALPPLGHAVYTLHRPRRGPEAPPRRASPPPIAASPTRLENDLLRVELDPATGWLSSLLDKRTGVDLVAGAAGPHTVVCADPTDTWGHRVVSYDWPGAEMRLERIRIRENGALRALVRVERRWNDSRLTEELLLGRDADHVEVRVTLDWHEPAHLMKLRFPTAIGAPEGAVEIPYGSIARPVDGAEQPGQSWVDLSGDVGGARAGLAIVNDGKHGYDLAPAGDRDGRWRSASIGITAVRSPVFAWHDPTTLEPDGIYAYQDQGVQRWTCLLVPHAGGWRDAGLHRRAAELNLRPRAMLESFHPGAAPAVRSFVSATAAGGAGSVQVTAVKSAEDGDDLVLRAVEVLGAPARAAFDLPLLGRRFEADFPPHRIRTWRVPRDPAQPAVEVDLVEWPLDGP